VTLKTPQNVEALRFQWEVYVAHVTWRDAWAVRGADRVGARVQLDPRRELPLLPVFSKLWDAAAVAGSARAARAWVNNSAA
jgi:hypothetical protein